MTETEVKERPIIMGAESVRAILAGRKTETRRVIKDIFNHEVTRTHPYSFEPGAFVIHGETDHGQLIRCPYGRPGDVLYVKETCVIHSEPDVKCPDPDGKVYYRADFQSDAKALPRWRSPLYMPRWACRITLEIQDVRVERLQDITPEDAYAEGIQPEWFDGGAALLEYSARWDQLNARRGYPWESNPWVWVLRFRPHHQ